jgi:hypothetical protein
MTGYQDERPQVTTKREPRFDLDLKIGAQSEMWVADICDLLGKRSGEIEVKAPKPFLAEGSFYVEYECLGRDGKWRPSGIQTTKAKVWVFTFGTLPGGLMVETEWLRRAARVAWKNPADRRECKRGSNPTKAVVVDIRCLWLTRGHEP